MKQRRSAPGSYFSGAAGSTTLHLLRVDRLDNDQPSPAITRARGLRDFGDGFVAVLLPVYLMALGFSPLEVGASAGTALFGSALLTLAVGFLGVRGAFAICVGIDFSAISSVMRLPH
jgi:hypothetical protein